MSSDAKDEDSVFLEHVLDKLYDFGAAKTRKKRNKRRRREEEEEEEEEEEGTCPEKDVCRTEDRLKTERPGRPGGEVEEEEEEEQQVEEGVEQVEVVTFQDPHKKQRSKPTEASSSEPRIPDQNQNRDQNQRPEELDLEKARLEVHRFGLTGYRKEQQREFERDRAVMLGARPPKKNYVNYKLLQQQVKDRKQRAREEVQPELKKKKKKQNQQDTRKKTSSGSAAPTGQVGRFKDGMLILSSKEIQKIKGRRGAR